MEIVDFLEAIDKSLDAIFGLLLFFGFFKVAIDLVGALKK